MARGADVALSPGNNASDLIAGEQAKYKDIHLRDWQRADLRNGEGDMGSGRKRASSICWGSDGHRTGRAERAVPAATASGHFGEEPPPRPGAVRRCAVLLFCILNPSLSAPTNQPFSVFFFLYTVGLFISPFAIDSALTN